MYVNWDDMTVMNYRIIDTVYGNFSFDSYTVQRLSFMIVALFIYSFHFFITLNVSLKW